MPFPPPRQRDRQRSGDSPFPSIPALKPKKQARWTWPPKKGTVGAELDGAWGHKMDTELGKDAPPMESQDGSEGRARDSLLLGSQGQEKQHACLGCPSISPRTCLCGAATGRSVVRHCILSHPGTSLRRAAPAGGLCQPVLKSVTVRAVPTCRVYA